MATDPDAYVRNLKTMDAAIKKFNAQLKSIKQQREVTRERLYRYLVRNNLEEYGGYKAKSIAPKTKIPVKKKAEKEADALRLFREVGIDDPDAFLVAFHATQKFKKPTDDDE